MAATTTYETFTPLARYDGESGETIKMVKLPLDAILIPDFQRERIARQIAKLAAEWDETAYGFPVVAGYKGGLICLDGQQRLAAAEEKGIPYVVVLLIEGVKKWERLANLFLKFNRDRKLLNAFEKFVAALTAKDRGTLDIAKLLESYGLVAGKSSSVNGRVPIGTVTYIYDKMGRNTLDRVLHIRTQAWHVPSKEANEGQTLLGLATFVKRHFDRLDDDRLIDLLRRHHPGYLLEATDQRRGSIKVAYSDHLRELYNKGLRGKARL